MFKLFLLFFNEMIFIPENIRHIFCHEGLDNVHQCFRNKSLCVQRHPASSEFFQSITLFLAWHEAQKLLELGQL